MRKLLIGGMGALAAITFTAPAQASPGDQSSLSKQC
jgi:hypothetical protein